VKLILILLLCAACNDSMESVPGAPVSIWDDSDAGVRCYVTDSSTYGSRGISCLKR